MGAPTAPVHPGAADEPAGFCCTFGGVSSSFAPVAAASIASLARAVRVRVLSARYPRVGDAIEAASYFCSFLVQRNHVRVLDLPAPRHLLHHQFRIHADLDLAGSHVGRSREPCDEPAVFGHVVGGNAQGGPSFRQHRRTVRGEDDSPVTGGTGVSARAAVCFDDDPCHCAHRPDSLVRTRIALHSEHRMSSSAGFAAILEISPRSSSIRQAPQRLA